MVIIVFIASIAGFTAGQFLSQEEQIETTESTITKTQTITSSSTIIETTTSVLTKTATSTTTVSRINFPLTTNETNGLIVGRMSNKGHVLITLSINSSTFYQGEIVNITATITNLTPENVTMSLIEFHLPIFRNQGSEVWRSPISLWPGGSGLRPPWTQDFNLKPFESSKIPYATTFWNLTGLKVSNETNRIIYSGEYVPEGKYKIEWMFDDALTSDFYSGKSYGGRNPPLELEFTVESPPIQLISAEDAVNIVAQFKGWNTTELESFEVFTEMRYVKENVGWIIIFTAEPETGELIKNIATHRPTIPDPIVNYRGHYWYISINTEPDKPPMEAGLYSQSFSVDAINAVIIT